MQVEVRLLGGFAILRDGAPVLDGAWRPRKAAAIVKILALQPGRTLHRDRLIDMLWPDGDAESGGNNLYKNLHQLRDALEAGGVARDLVRIQGGMLSLAPDVEVDVDTFRSRFQAARTTAGVDELTAAVDAYTGELLPHDPYEDWASVPREELRLSALDLRLRLGHLHADGSRFEEAARQYEAALRIESSAEEAHRGLMRAYASNGRRDMALRQYERCVEELANDLGAMPSPETDALAGEIRHATRVPLQIEPSPLPEVRYTTTSDGVRIAYTDEGDGPPLVHMSQLPWNHLLRELDMPEWRAWHEALGAGRRYIRYDGRGRGLSDREGHILSVETEILDLSAVVDVLGLEEFDLYCGFQSSMTAISYAARNPEKVRKLALWNAYASNPEVMDTTAARSSRTMLEAGYETYCEFAASGTTGFHHPEAAHTIAAILIDSAGVDFVTTWFTDQYMNADASADLPAVRCPVLVVENRAFPIDHDAVRAARRVAEGLEDVQIYAREIANFTPFMEDLEANIKAIRGFFDAPVGNAEPPGQASATPTIVNARPIDRTRPGASSGAALVVRQNGNLGERISLCGTPLMLGRKGDNDLVLDSPQVSRYHARVSPIGGGYRVEDLDSKNGTRVNGHRIQNPVTLSDGDTIEVGDFTIVFQTDATETLTLTGSLARPAD